MRNARFLLLGLALTLAGACARGVTVLGDGAGGAGGDETTWTGQGGSHSTGGAGGSDRDAGSEDAMTDAAPDGPPPTCVGPSDCAALSDACNQGTCVNGLCAKQPANELGACDDGLFCTDNEACTNGFCGGGTPKFCPGGDTCHVGMCDEANKTCSVAVGNDGAACADSDPCTQTAACDQGKCVAQSPKDCSFLDSTCAVGVCDPKLGCVQKPQADGSPCDDGLYCTVKDQCVAGSCKGQPNTCAPPGDVCMIGTCDEAQKTCVSIPGNDGAKCSTGNLCLSGETCAAGKCGSGVAANEGKACSPADKCQLGTTCAQGVCANPQSVITQCLPNDDCCPVNCDGAGSPDNDCKPAVGIVGATPDPTWLGEVVNTQVATGAFLSVTPIDAASATPSVAELQTYRAVLVFSDTGFQDPKTLGDNLATYFDGGGRVVLAAFANASVPVTGTFGTPANGYVLIDPAAQESPVDSLGLIAEPASSLVKDVSTLSAQAAYRSTGKAINGGVVVASWQSGAPLIVRGVVKGRNRVDLNLYPPSVGSRSDFWSGDGAQIIRNALLFK